MISAGVEYRCWGFRLFIDRQARRYTVYHRYEHICLQSFGQNVRRFCDAQARQRSVEGSVDDNAMSRLRSDPTCIEKMDEALR